MTSALLVGDYAGDAFQLTDDGSGGTKIAAAPEPWASVATGDTLVTNISGQGYSAYANRFNGGTHTETDFFYTGVAGQAYDSYGYDYSSGGAPIGSKFFFPGKNANYAYEEVDYDGAVRPVRIAFTGVTGAPYSGYDYDYAGGVLSDKRFTYSSVPSGASFTSYETDFNNANALDGEKFFFKAVTDQPYTGEEIDYDAHMKLSRVLLTGVVNQAYGSLELDYAGGVYSGYTAFYTGVTGTSYKAEEVEVSAAGQLQKVVYSGMSATPYSSVRAGLCKRGSVGCDLQLHQRCRSELLCLSGD